MKYLKNRALDEVCSPTEYSEHLFAAMTAWEERSKKAGLVYNKQAWRCERRVVKQRVKRDLYNAMKDWEDVVSAAFKRTFVHPAQRLTLWEEQQIDDEEELMGPYSEMESNTSSSDSELE